ncbi:hypothetical protein OUZ56_011466 [Daphnia magna]|uniref:Uncharacterized protein n=1 Tax=Daphnia magna TaxID=35525 RepID=A0ABQ9Z095_9CRUS|nr:hypothetical protein OUZ56_011466 [Daphnia magna]
MEDNASGESSSILTADPTLALAADPTPVSTADQCHAAASASTPAPTSDPAPEDTTPGPVRASGRKRFLPSHLDDYIVKVPKLPIPQRVRGVEIQKNLFIFAFSIPSSPPTFHPPFYHSTPVVLSFLLPLTVKVTKFTHGQSREDDVPSTSIFTFLSTKCYNIYL